MPNKYLKENIQQETSLTLHLPQLHAATREKEKVSAFRLLSLGKLSTMELGVYFVSKKM